MLSEYCWVAGWWRVRVGLVIAHGGAKGTRGGGLTVAVLLRLGSLGMSMVVKWWECAAAMGVRWRNKDSFWCCRGVVRQHPAAQ